MIMIIIIWLWRGNLTNCEFKRIIKTHTHTQYKGFPKKKNPPLFPHLLCNSERLLKQLQIIEDDSRNPIPMVRSKQCHGNCR